MVEVKQEPGRWRMQRAGMLNFWYYDEEVFELEDGRLILRGANGSGKSVTMQSFLPLVLDGDKRPHRIDPFGSRDRRIEYYLLGETDSGKSDVTGYLWMEFVNAEKGLFKTIGIGLRARRGATQVQFWGFLLEDGRRIGKDFWLYDRNDWFEHKARVPFSRPELEKAIGNGGHVVQEQSSYRDLVNKHVFGFTDADAFEDLLHLMIQLRSPKLSKDFKPTAIYEILHGSLPPLQDDDLRPLSEVLEDMDQIADRLDEVRMHKKEMTKLQDVYDRYNKRTLYDLSNHVLERNEHYSSMNRQTAEQEASLSAAQQIMVAAVEAIAQLDNDLQSISTELEILDKHEAVEKHRELESATNRLEQTEKERSLAQGRVGKHRVRQQTLETDLAEVANKHQQYIAEQLQLLKELEEMSVELEFSDHSVNERNWDVQGTENERRRDSWRRDLQQHRERLETALGKAKEEREEARAVQELEGAMGEARKERDVREREHGENAQALDSAKDTLRESIRMWQLTLQELSYDDEYLRQTFGALTSYGITARSLDPIRDPLIRALALQRDRLGKEKLRLQHKKDELLVKEAELQADKKAWEESREPEPERSEARRNRRTLNAPGSGAPLYAVCDFQHHVAEVERARLEEALERAGLLDAWISTDGQIGTVVEGQEEVWIVPQPHEIGYTLADVLRPSPSADSGLKHDLIDQVLRSFLWTDEGNLSDEGMTGAALSGSGWFRLGPLTGSSRASTRAKYIGYETRKRTRQLEIARLQQELARLTELMIELDAALAFIGERENLLHQENASFPSLEQLDTSMQQLLEAAYRLNVALEQETKVLHRYKEANARWRELQRELHVLTSDWIRLKREKELAEAVSLTKDYDHTVSQLFTAWLRGVETEQRRGEIRRDQEAVEASLYEDEERCAELEELRLQLRAQVQALRHLMKELGLEDITSRMETLKSNRKKLDIERKKADEQRNQAKDEALRAQTRLELMQEDAIVLAQKLRVAFDAWHKDLLRGFVEEWKASVPIREDVEAAVQWSQNIKQRYESLFANRNVDMLKNQLLEQFNAVRGVLAEYVMEIDIEEDTGRIVIQSKRDRTHPQPPVVIVEQLTRDEETQTAMLSEKDRELYEEIILRSVGKAIRQRIHRAESWVKSMNRLMEDRNTSSGLRLKLDWEPKVAHHEQQMDTSALVELLKRDSHRLRDDEIDAMIQHFRYQIGYAKQSALSEKESLRKHLYEVLDYRNWFQFELKYRKGEQAGYRPLTDSRFNVLSGGEKAMAMYIPLFAAAWSRYSDARVDAPRLISLDEAFAGVDEENMRDMFGLLSEMGFDYMMTSQVLWGCYDTVAKLAIYELHRPKDVDFVTTFHYRWNGRVKEFIASEGDVS